jgi:Family of unknown function (DUF6339)
VAPSTRLQSSRVLRKVVDVEFMVARDVYDRLCSGNQFLLEDVQVQSATIPFDFRVSPNLDLAQSRWIVEDEVEVAISLHKALHEAKTIRSGLLNEHGIWTWIGVEVLRDYVVNRWCKGYENGRPQSPEKCEYFLTGDGVHAQSRCAVRRLYIAAETSVRADGDYRWIAKFLDNADIFSAIFERRLGMDSELAVAMLDAYSSLGSGSRATYRKASKLIGLALSTTCLEALDKADKRALVDDALNEVSLGLVDGA